MATARSSFVKQSGVNPPRRNIRSARPKAVAESYHVPDFRSGLEPTPAPRRLPATVVG